MINVEQQGLERTIYTPETVSARLVLAHGAGAGNRHEFMKDLALQLAQFDIQVVSFNFPYMQTMYQEDKRRPPNKLDALLAQFEQELKLADSLAPQVPTFIGGKSMGGRVASLLSTQEKFNGQIVGTLVFGYPFIPPGKPEKLAARIQHFPSLISPMRVFQGERDSFGNEALLDELEMRPPVSVKWIPSGDHSYKPLKSSGLTQAGNIQLAAKLAAEFIFCGAKS